ncbi:MAG: hypothetical protein JRE23_16805 [Deltaproteobacteria bacterium]|nr:hypothetical protein [Deltaproteobacteria bacterium]
MLNSKVISVILNLSVFAVVTTVLSASVDLSAKESSLEVTGFADFYHLFEGNHNSSNFGQIEFDFEMGLQKSVSAAAAIVFDPDDGLFKSGAFEIDFCLIGEEDSSFYQKEGIGAMGFVLGQFDVPFGIDYLVYPSIDRWMVTRPIVVGEIHDCWNDYGLKVYLETEFVNGMLYTTNCQKFAYEDTALVVAVGDTISYCMQSKRSIGGRIGITPYEMIEIGGSFAGFLNAANETAMTVFGVDLQFNYKGLRIKGEYISKENCVELEQCRFTQDGYYIQGLYDFGKVFAFGRYGLYSSGEDNADDLKRVCLGGGCKIVECCRACLEYQTWLDNHEASDALYLQTVIGF